MTDAARPAPAQLRATVVAAAGAGAYRHLVLAAPAASQAVPGQFVALAVGDDTSAMLLRRAFSVHRADPAAGTVEVVVAGHGPGSRWVAARRTGEQVDVVGPLGHGFELPPAGSRLVLVGGGYGSAPFAWTASAAIAAGVRVDAVVGAGDAARLCDVAGIRAVVEPAGGTVHVTTDDGSAGRRGRVTDALADLLDDLGTPTTVAACGPMVMLAAVTATSRAAAAAAGAVVDVQVAVEEAMACGIGICMTCVLPVADAAGTTRMVRACTEGPVLAGDRVRWDCIGPDGASVPADAVGAPAGGAL